jgi:hypothetical protein
MRKQDSSVQLENMLQAKDIETLSKKIEDLNATMADGFRGVHARQNKTNGNVIHAQEDITTLKAKFEYNRIIWYLLTTSISVVITLVSYILFKT